MTKDDYYSRKYKNAPYDGLTILFLLMLLMICFSQAHGATLQERVIENSSKYLQVRELHNDNRSPHIDQWLRYLGLPPGLSYCAAFTIWNYHEAGFNLPKYGRVASLWKTCQARELTYKTFDAEAVSMKIERLHPGDIPVWAHGRINAARDFNGHTGIVLRQLDRTAFLSREGNTMPSNAGNQREGGGVYDRTRGLGFGSSFKVVGFIRVR